MPNRVPEGTVGERHEAPVLTAPCGRRGGRRWRGRGASAGSSRRAARAARATRTRRTSPEWLSGEARYLPADAAVVVLLGDGDWHKGGAVKLRPLLRIDAVRTLDVLHVGASLR